MTFVYGTIDRVYIDRVQLHSLGVAGLDQLARLDPDLEVQDQGASVQLAYKGTPIAQFDLPENRENPSAWGRFTATGAALAKSISPKLGEMSREDLLSALLNPALQRLDPYTRYLSPVKAKAEQAARRGFGGIGVILDPEQTGLIRNILEEAPAAQAGILPGDRILRVGETSVAPLSPQQLLPLLQGEAGSTVSVTFQRAQSAPFIRHLTRQKLFQTSVRAQGDEKGILTLKLFAFHEGTLEEFKTGVKHYTKTHALRGMILDLRDNPGGTFQTALEIADLFLSEGTIVSTRNRRGIAYETMAKAGNEIVPQTLPMAVLINGQTASASEVLASALQDRSRAIIVGSGSFGKGLVQTVYENLPNRGELILTTLRLHPPLGYSLHRYGVIPTVCTARWMNSPQAADRAIAEIRSPDFHPEAVLTARRTADRSTEAERSALVRLCPPSTLARPRDDLDQTLARSLLADPSLYARALPASTLAKRP